MRIVVIAVLTFAAGLLVGSTFFAERAEEPGDLAGLSADDVPAGTAADAETSDAASDPQGTPRTDTEDVAPPPRLEPARPPPGSFRASDRRGWVLALLNEAYATYRRQAETALPAELARKASDSALAHFEKQAFNFGGWMSTYIDQQRNYGTLGDPPRVVVQVRGSGSLDSSERSPERMTWLRKSPLDLGSAFAQGEVFRAGYLETGVVPLDRVLVIERIDLVGRLGAERVSESAHWLRRGTLEVRVDSQPAFQRQGEEGKEVRGSLIGLGLVTPPWNMPTIRLEVRNGVAGLVAHGRYVTREAAAKLRDRAFHWAPEGDDGLLGTDSVVLQVVADHGGGNARRVRLDGSTYRIDQTKEADLWNPHLDLRKNRRSFARAEHVGVVPHGKIFRITRIAWRTRLDPKQSSHSDFIVRFQRKTLVEHQAKDAVENQGVWEGELDVRPGQEKEFEIECSYYGLGEAVIDGSVIDPEKPKK